MRISLRLLLDQWVDVLSTGGRYRLGGPRRGRPPGFLSSVAAGRPGSLIIQISNCSSTFGFVQPGHNHQNPPPSSTPRTSKRLSPVCTRTRTYTQRHHVRSVSNHESIKWRSLVEDPVAHVQVSKEKASPAHAGR